MTGDDLAVGIRLMWLWATTDALLRRHLEAALDRGGGARRRRINSPGGHGENASCWGNFKLRPSIDMGRGVATREQGCVDRRTAQAQSVIAKGCHLSINELLNEDVLEGCRE